MKRLLLLVLLAAPVMAQAQSPQDLFQEALRLERSQGDLSGAIALYQRVAANFGGDRELGAEALLRMAQAYEQLGETEAERAYRRIVAEFGDQEETAAAAREALGRLVAPEAVDETPATDWSELDARLTAFGLYAATVSPDGQYFSNVDMETGQLAVQRRGGTMKYVTTPDSTRYPWTARFSANSDQLAFAVSRIGVDGVELWLHEMESSQNSLLVDLRATVGAEYAEVFDWADTGESILIGFDTADQQYLATVGLNGEIRLRAELKNGYDYERACLFEDRYALFDTEVEEESPFWGVRRLDLETGREQLFYDVRANTRLVACSQRANLVVLRTDLYGASQSITFPVQDALPAGLPKVLPDTETVDMGLALSHDGEIHYYRDRTARMEVFPISPDGTQVTGQALDLGLQNQWSKIVGWAREIDQVAWFTWAFGIDIQKEGEVRRLTLDHLEDIDFNPAFDFTRFSMSADGTAFIGNRMLTTSRRKTKGVPGTYWLDAGTGVITDTLANVWGTPGMTGRSIVASRRASPVEICVDEWEIASADPKQLVCYQDDYSGSAHRMVFSSDGSKLAVISYPSIHEDWFMQDAPQTDDHREVITVVDLASGESKLVWQYDTSDGYYWSTEWLPDQSGFMILKDRVLYRLPLDGSGLEPVLGELTSGREVFRVRMHPTEPKLLARTYEPVLRDTPRIRILGGVTVERD